ncbi:hypothetical protein HOD38_01620 [archaeon]|jgi:hypothetical protein|nr:hypothetical protein [archaeon]MBT4396943.1 hypothetical protein [archaeon]MBT4440934.1 hypothetical protein [archaeon]
MKGLEGLTGETRQAKIEELAAEAIERLEAWARQIEECGANGHGEIRYSPWETTHPTLGYRAKRGRCVLCDGPVYRPLNAREHRDDAKFRRLCHTPITR